MIDITTMVDYIEGFDHNDFTYVNYEKALLERDCQQTEDGWFDKHGEFIAKRTVVAAIKLSLQNVCDRHVATGYYIVSPGVRATRRSVINEVHGVMIMGVAE